MFRIMLTDERTPFAPDVVVDADNFTDAWAEMEASGKFGWVAPLDPAARNQVRAQLEEDGVVEFGWPGTKLTAFAGYAG